MAIECFDQVIRLDPGHAGALFQKAMTLRDLERFDEALVAFENVIDLLPDELDAWFGKGSVLQSMARTRRHSKHSGTFLIRTRITRKHGSGKGKYSKRQEILFRPLHVTMKS
jgi:tetratricopeptide (TPR) repeat protein